MNKTDRIERIKELLAIVESGDAKAKGWRHIAGHMDQLHDEGMTWVSISTALGRHETWVHKVMKWRTSGSASTPFGGELENEARYERHTKQTLVDPKRLEKALAELPDEAVEGVRAKAFREAGERAAVRHETLPSATGGPTVDELMEGEKFDPSESWADTLIMRVGINGRKLGAHVAKWGLVIGSLSAEDALEYLETAEREIAEVRAAVQERIRDGVAA